MIKSGPCAAKNAPCSTHLGGHLGIETFRNNWYYRNSASIRRQRNSLEVTISYSRKGLDHIAFHYFSTPSISYSDLLKPSSRLRGPRPHMSAGVF